MTFATRLTSETLNCGQGAKGLLRRGSPPRMASLDLIRTDCIGLRFGCCRPPHAFGAALNPIKLEGLSEPGRAPGAVKHATPQPCHPRDLRHLPQAQPKVEAHPKAQQRRQQIAHYLAFAAQEVMHHG